MFELHSENTANLDWREMITIDKIKYEQNGEKSFVRMFSVNFRWKKIFELRFNDFEKMFK
ncbi:MAG TPA: hypothetical protein ENG99_00795 [bacterium]|nr:hypothetical protein [bacterium]